MAEETVWNKKLLIASLVLGLVAAVLFVAYDRHMERKATGDIVTLLVWKRDLGPGSPISMNDVGFRPMRKSLADRYQEVLRNTTNDLNYFQGDAYVRRRVYKSDFIRSNDILEEAVEPRSAAIGDNMRAVTLRVDPAATQGDMLQVDDRVDVIGMFDVDGKGPRAYTFLPNVRVLAVGGQSAPPEEQFRKDLKGRRYRPTMRSYRSLTVEVTPKTAELLVDLMARIHGKISIALRPPPRGGKRSRGSGRVKPGEINPQVLKVLKQPLPEEVSEG